MYWILETDILTWHNQPVQAKLITPESPTTAEDDCGYGFRGPKQINPYGIDLSLTYEINPQHPHPDNYFESFGFTLYSKKLVDLMAKFDVTAEVFPANIVDKDGRSVDELNYYIFHLLEDILDAMDEQGSKWTGSRRAGIPRLVLDYEKFEHRPLFICNSIYAQLIHNDLKQEIEQQKITGFTFTSLKQYKSGRYRIRSM